MRNVDLDKAHTILREAFRPARRTSVNTFLVHSKGRLAIIDTGSGNYLLPTAGFVQRNLAAAVARISPVKVNWNMRWLRKIAAQFASQEKFD